MFLYTLIALLVVAVSGQECCVNLAADTVDNALFFYRTELIVDRGEREEHLVEDIITYSGRPIGACEHVKRMYLRLAAKTYAETYSRDTLIRHVADYLATDVKYPEEEPHEVDDYGDLDRKFCTFAN